MGTGSTFMVNTDVPEVECLPTELPNLLPESRPHAHQRGWKRLSVKRFHQLRILLWKNFLLRRRSPFLLSAELLFPFVFIIILLAFRVQQPVYAQPMCHVQSQSMPSMGFIHYLQSLVCNFNYTCYPTEPKRGMVLEENTPFFYLLQNITELLNDQDLISMASSYNDDISFADIFTVWQAKRKLLSVFDSYHAFTAWHNVSGLSFLSLEYLKRTSRLLCGRPIDQNDLGRLFVMLQTHTKFNISEFMDRVQPLVVDNETSLNESRRGLQELNLCRRLEYLITLKPLANTLGRLRHLLFGQTAYFPQSTSTEKIIEQTEDFTRLLSYMRHLVGHFFNVTRPLLTELLSNGSRLVPVRNQLRECSEAHILLPIRLSRLCCFLWLWTSPSPTSNYVNPTPSCSAALSPSIHWTDSLNDLDYVLGILKELLECIRLDDKVIAFQNQSEFDSFLAEAQSDLLRSPFGLIFESLPTTPRNDSIADVFSIRLRKNPLLIDTTFRYKALDPRWNAAPRRDSKTDMKYFTSGFIDIQEAIGRSILSLMSSASQIELLNLGTEFQMFPTSSYVEDKFLHIFAPNLPQCMVLAWSLTLVCAVKYIVEEKQYGFSTMLTLLNLPTALIHLSWLIVSLCITTLTSVPIVLCLKYGGILPNSDPFLLFCFIFSYVLSVLTYALIWTNLFSHANLTAVLSGCVYFMCYLPAPVLIRYENLLPVEVLMGFSILPQVSHSIGWTYFVRLEVEGLGGHWHNLWLADNSGGPYSLGMCFLLLWCSSGLHLSFAYLLIPWCKRKLCIVGLWCSKHLRTWSTLIVRSALSSSKNGKPDEYDEYRVLSKLFEDNLEEGIVPFTDANLRKSQISSPSVTVLHVVKTYHHTDLKVLDNVSLTFYPDEIIALLGHNGAGKTTLLSILVGMVKPTTGDVFIHKLNTKQHDERCRNGLGFCPQHDILYPNMTVSEHIYLYKNLGCVHTSALCGNLVSYLRQFGFEHKQNALIGTLSGGQKRKLSVCLAFLNSASVILLDEPTASVDPLYKRVIWNRIQSMRAGRTILFTSHHMREAEFLADQISILSTGRVLYSGSTVALKTSYDLGYKLTVEKNLLFWKNHSSTVTLVDFIQHHIPEAAVLDESTTDLTVQVPLKAILDGRCVSLLEQFERILVEKDGVLPISRFDISISSLDDLFSKLLRCDSIEEKNSSDLDGPYEPFFTIDMIHDKNLTLSKAQSINQQISDRQEVSHSERIFDTGLSQLHCPKPKKSHHCLHSFDSQLPYQFIVILLKRFYHFERYKWIWLVLLIAPCVLVLFTIVVLSCVRPEIQQPIMELNPWLITSRRNVRLISFFSHDILVRPTESSMDIAAVYEAAFKQPLSWTATCCLDRTIHIPRPPFIPLCEHQSESNRWESRVLDQSTNVHKLTGNRSTSFHQAVPFLRIPTNDLVLNLSGLNITQYLLLYEKMFSGETYGGLELVIEHKAHPRELLKEFFTSLYQWLLIATRWLSNQTEPEGTDNPKMELNEILRILLPPKRYVRTWYNNKGHPAAPAYLNMLHNMQLKMLISNESRAHEVGFFVSNHPLPFLQNTWSFMSLSVLKFEAAFALFLLVALSFVPATFAALPIEERRLGLKHLQKLYGLHPLTDILANFSFDLMLYLGPASVMILLLVVFQKSAYVSPATLLPFVSVIFLYGCSMILLVYLLTFCFHTPSGGFVTICAINMIVASVTLSINFFLTVTTAFHNSSLLLVTKLFRNLFLISPHYCLGSTIFELALNRFLVEQDVIPNVELFSAIRLVWPQLLSLLVESVGFFALLIVLEDHSILEYFHRPFYRWPLCFGASIRHPSSLNTDGVSQPTSLVIRNLTKRYRNQPHAALNQFTLTVHGGECFGLLGMNGAGKSTTFAMLTGQFPVPPGTIFVDGCDVASQPDFVYRNLGYCPQSNALHDFLTARETLVMYGRLRLRTGEKRFHRIVDQLLEQTGLLTYADRLVGTLSGGTKRKLSVAIAFLGEPKIILLDEPSTGMDPLSRRRLWTLIRSALGRNRVILLSSHCMEECEALCSRVGLLMEGQLQCNGSPLELKQRFRVCYVVNYQLSTSVMNSDPVALQHQIEQYLPGIVLSSPLSLRQQYHYPPGQNVSVLFTKLQQLYELHLISYFSVKSSTLEDVFLECARSVSSSLAFEFV